MKIRRASERGHTKLDWLDSWHTFSFGEYIDPKHMGYGVLRVINDDTITPGSGFGTHAHQNMEIISYVLNGALEHKDSMGNTSIIRPQDVQRMSAGTGVTHSEFNSSLTKQVHFLQIWILPKEMNIPPSYEQKNFSANEDGFMLVATGNKNDNTVFINQDVNMHIGVLDNPGKTLDFNVDEQRGVWVHIAIGEVNLNGIALSAGDGAQIDGPTTLHFTNGENSKVIVFDMPSQPI